MQDLAKKEKYKKALGLVIKREREKTHKSISLISDEIDMTKSMWADLEKGIKDPQLSTVMRIAEALNIKASVIVDKLEQNLGEDFLFSD